MPRRCTNCANARRQQQHIYSATNCQEAGTDPAMSTLCWLTTVGGSCGRSICKMMRGVTWVLGTSLCCITAWMVYSEFSGCVTNFIWNLIYTFLGIAACAIILVVLSGPENDSSDEAVSSASSSKRSANGLQGASAAGSVFQTGSIGGSSGISKQTSDGRTAGAGESGKRGAPDRDDTEIRVTDLSSSDEMRDYCDPCPAAEED